MYVCLCLQESLLGFMVTAFNDYSDGAKKMCIHVIYALRNSNYKSRRTRENFTLIAGGDRIKLGPKHCFLAPCCKCKLSRSCDRFDVSDTCLSTITHVQRNSRHKCRVDLAPHPLVSKGDGEIQKRRGSWGKTSTKLLTNTLHFSVVTANWSRHFDTFWS